MADHRLSSQTNSTGSPNTCAQFSDSAKGPRLIAPSPKKHATISGAPRIRAECAAPTAIGRPAATTPFAPSMPTPKSAMCIEPPRPPQLPPSRPCSSCIMRPTSAPFAIVWPWPRCVDVR